MVEERTKNHMTHDRRTPHHSQEDSRETQITPNKHYRLRFCFLWLNDMSFSYTCNVPFAYWTRHSGVWWSLMVWTTRKLCRVYVRINRLGYARKVQFLVLFPSYTCMLLLSLGVLNFKHICCFFFFFWWILNIYIVGFTSMGLKFN